MLPKAPNMRRMAALMKEATPQELSDLGSNPLAEQGPKNMARGEKQKQAKMAQGGVVGTSAKALYDKAMAARNAGDTATYKAYITQINDTYGKPENFLAALADEGVDISKEYTAAKQQMSNAVDQHFEQRRIARGEKPTPAATTSRKPSQKSIQQRLSMPSEDIGNRKAIQKRLSTPTYAPLPPDANVDAEKEMLRQSMPNLSEEALTNMARNLASSRRTTRPKMSKGGIMTPTVQHEDGAIEPVPPGALPNEVMDNVDVKLSEGEVVLPADVVRWVGLQQIEEMRASAKEGLARMDAEGRIKAPSQGLMSPRTSESNSHKMATGGVVGTTDFIDANNDGIDDRFANGQQPQQEKPKPTATPNTPPAQKPSGGLMSPKTPTSGDAYQDTYNAANPATPVVAGTDQYGRKGYANTNAQGAATPGPRITAPQFTPSPAGSGSDPGLRPDNSGSGSGGGSSSPDLVSRVTTALGGLAATAGTVMLANSISDVIKGKGVGAALNENVLDPITGAIKKVSEWLGISTPTPTYSGGPGQLTRPGEASPIPVTREGALPSQTTPPAGTTTTPGTVLAPGQVLNNMGGAVTPDLLGRPGWNFTDTGSATLNTGVNIGLDIAGGYLGAKLSGMLSDRTGASWGSMIGGAAVAAAGMAGAFSAGSALAFMAMPGVGAFVGAFVGGVLGGQFGAKPSLGLNVSVNVNNFSDKGDPWNQSLYKDGDFRAVDPRVDKNGSKQEAVDNITQVVTGIADGASDAAKDIAASLGLNFTKRTNYGFEYVANPNREKETSGPGQFVITKAFGGQKVVLSRITADEQGALKALNDLTVAMLRDGGVLDSTQDEQKKQAVQTAMASGNVFTLLSNKVTRPATSTPTTPATTAPTPSTPTPAIRTPAQPTTSPVGSNGFQQRTQVTPSTSNGIMAPRNTSSRNTTERNATTAPTGASFGDNLKMYGDIYKGSSSPT